MAELSYRLLHDPQDLKQAVDLQRLVWGDDPQALIPFHMLHSLAFNGCPLLGAFDGALLVGLSIAFFGTDVPDSNRPAMANLKLASKRLAVHPDYRSAGIGYQLKLAQKRFANQQAIRLITWTYDPLISRNAHLYIRKLGGIGRRYIPDFYADAPAQVERIEATDRFIVEWWVTSRRVEERINGKRKELTLASYLSSGIPLLNPTRLRADGLPLPYAGTIQITEHSLLLVEVPADHQPLQRDPHLGRDWREHTRTVFAQTFNAGYIVTDFLHEPYEGHERSFYVMGFDGI